MVDAPQNRTRFRSVLCPWFFIVFTVDRTGMVWWCSSLDSFQGFPLPSMLSDDVACLRRRWHCTCLRAFWVKRWNVPRTTARGGNFPGWLLGRERGELPSRRLLHDRFLTSPPNKIRAVYMKFLMFPQVVKPHKVVLGERTGGYCISNVSAASSFMVLGLQTGSVNCAAKGSIIRVQWKSKSKAMVVLGGF